jgi:hypothetical protein
MVIALSEIRMTIANGNASWLLVVMHLMRLKCLIKGF